MPEFDAGQSDLTSLLARTAQVVVAAQERLDRPSWPSGQLMYSIPSVTASLEFGLVTRSTKRFLFIPTKRSSARLSHRILFSLHATPEPPLPLLDNLPAENELFPVTLIAPPFLAGSSEEQLTVERLLSALRGGRWRAVMRRPEKLDQRRLDEAALVMEEAYRKPDPGRPDLGVTVFRVNDEPAQWLIVHLTRDSDNDGVFLLSGGPYPDAMVFTAAGDRNDKIAYLPLHLLMLSMRRWLGEGAARKVALASGLPRRWGISSLEHLGRSLMEGYRLCVETLASRSAEGPPVFFDIAGVTAEISYSVSYARQTPQFSVTAQPQGPLPLEGRVRVSIGRRERAAFMELTLLAPGFVLTAASRDEFVTQARAAAGEIARCFTMHPREQEEYRQCLLGLADPREVVVLVSAEKAGACFGHLAVWPGPHAIERRDFVFSCKQRAGRLDDFHAVMRLDDELGSVSIDAPGSADGGLAEDQYQHFHRFFTGARIWSAGMEGS